MNSENLLERVEDFIRTKPRANPDKKAPTIFREGLELDPDHWFWKRPLALPLATAVWRAIEEIGDEKLTDTIHLETYGYIGRNRCTEYSEIPQQQKTAFGEFIQIGLTKLFEWQGNKKGLDVKLALDLDGIIEFCDMEIKASNTSINKGKKKKNDQSGPMPDQWQISLECAGEINLLISVDTYHDNFSIGLLDCSQEGFLKEINKPKNNKAVGGPQRDGKKSLTTLGKNNIVWIRYRMPMDPNPLPERAETLKEYWERCDREFKRIIRGQTDQQRNIEKRNSLTT